jgi:hypothetical protein
MTAPLTVRPELAHPTTPINSHAASVDTAALDNMLMQRVTHNLCQNGHAVTHLF